jgi:heparanase 1
MVRRCACAMSLLWLVACDGPDRRTHVVIDGSRPVAMVSERFLSIAIDTAQVVGGAFWTPGDTSGSGTAPVPPFDFTRARLLALAGPLGHAMLRVGGTDADRTYYALGDPPPSTPPPGYQWILTRAQFDALSAFASALDFQILFTLNAGVGPRDQQGPWQPDNARALMRYATQAAAPLAVWELGNEVNAYPLLFGFTLSPADYAADVQTARTLVAAEAPGARLAAPASAYWPLIGELGGLLPEFARIGGDRIDVLSWHYYPQQSARCAAAVLRATPTRLLDPSYLDEIDRWADEVEQARAGHAPQAEGWLDETSNAQCGGAPGISDAFVSSLWWLDELGKMAQRGTPVVVRQSLTGADYGLLAEPSLDPRPDYFASLLWRRLMGTRVLAVTTKNEPSLRAYAHCTEGRAGAVTLLLINLDLTRTLNVAVDGIGEARELYAVDADDLSSPTARLNGEILSVGADNALPALRPRLVGGDTIALSPTTYAFAILSGAGAACGGG